MALMTVALTWSTIACYWSSARTWQLYSDRGSLTLPSGYMVDPTCHSVIASTIARPIFFSLGLYARIGVKGILDVEVKLAGAQAAVALQPESCRNQAPSVDPVGEVVAIRFQARPIVRHHRAINTPFARFEKS